MSELKVKNVTNLRKVKRVDISLHMLSQWLKGVKSYTSDLPSDTKVVGLETSWATLVGSPTPCLSVYVESDEFAEAREGDPIPEIQVTITDKKDIGDHDYPMLTLQAREKRPDSPHFLKGNIMKNLLTIILPFVVFGALLGALFALTERIDALEKKIDQYEYLDSHSMRLFAEGIAKCDTGCSVYDGDWDFTYLFDKAYQDLQNERR